MQFADIPGLDELKEQLTNAFKKGKVAHAQLFSGNLGTATFPVAFAYATYLMCDSKVEGDSCDTCANCLRMKKAIHPDVHWIFPKVSASNGNKYEKVLADALPSWRTFIAESPYGSPDDWALKYGQENKNLQISREDSRQVLKNVSMKSVEGGYKIIFIWGAEFMHPTGANAILKILEEPPEKTIYLLISFNYDALLQTIISRSHLVNVPPHTMEDVQEYLTLKMKVDANRALQVAKIAQGKIGSGLKHLQNEGEVAYGLFRDWMLACWNRDFTRLVKSSENFAKTGKASQREFLMFSLSIIRNAVLKTAGNQMMTLNEEEDVFITKYAEKLGIEKLQTMYELLNESLLHLERNANPRITHLNLSLAIVEKISA